MKARKVIARLPIQFTHIHVPAHQDIMRERWIFGGEQTMIVIRTIRPSGSRKTMVTVDTRRKGVIQSESNAVHFYPCFRGSEKSGLKGNGWIPQISMSMRRGRQEKVSPCHDVFG
jgi:hypothetical protein